MVSVYHVQKIVLIVRVTSAQYVKMDIDLLLVENVMRIVYQASTDRVVNVRIVLLLIVINVRLIKHAQNVVKDLFFLMMLLLVNKKTVVLKASSKILVVNAQMIVV